MSAIKAFFGVLFVLLFVVAVTSNGALKGPDAFALRWTVLSLAVGLSALAAWVRWRMSQPGTASSPSEASQRQNGLPVDVRSAAPLPKPPAAPPATAPIDVDVEMASKHAIVFRQHFLPRHEPTLSFFGGAPIAPGGFRWPRPAAGGDRSRPFSFLMQIDCAAVPASGRAGMLPDRGVLYFFLDLTWGQADAFRVLYADARDTDRWSVIQPPDDMGAAFGDGAVSMWKWPQSVEACPKLLPKWTFDPVVIDVPAPPPDPEEDAGAPVLWPGEKATAESLRAAQGEDVGNWFTVKDFAADDRTLRRPFANYPQDWRAVQICSGLIAERLHHAHGLMGTSLFRERSETEREALRLQIRDEALSWFARAASSEPFAAVPQPESDPFWSWLEAYPGFVRFVIVDAVTLSIEASLADSPEAAARIPADVARRIHNRHALAVLSEHGIYANTPDRMLAPPVDVQGNQWDRAKTHLLLLEISSDEGLGHHFGEGVIQFWITPADLRARRFDRVEQTSDAY